MSNPQAIAAVTATLHHLLRQEFTDGTEVSTQPPDRARGNKTEQQLNLFLYHMELNGTWRNHGMPGQVTPGETPQPPLGLNLYYLLTAYGRSDEDVSGHHVLGRAMRRLHDHPVLGRKEIKDALQGNDLGDQVERVRITHQPLSLEEMSKVWTAFQTNYRISTAYEVAVVLIESHRSSRTPLPVLTRGKDDAGVPAQADLLPPFPILAAVVPPDGQPSARLGDTLTLTGHHLAGANLGIQFQHRRWDDPEEVPPEANPTATALTVKLQDGAPPPWLAGIYTVSLLVQRPGDVDRRVSNEVALSLAPTIAISTNPAPIVNGKATIKITVVPAVLPEQRTALLLGERELTPSARSADGKELTFVVNDAVKGDYFLRLRVDGVDSLLVIDRDPEAHKVPRFDPTQTVTLQ